MDSSSLSCVHASDDDFMVIRFLASGTTGTGEDLMAVLLLTYGSGATGDSLTSCCDAFSPPSLFLCCCRDLKSATR